MTEHQVIAREFEHQRIRRNHGRPAKRVQMIFTLNAGALPDTGQPLLFGEAAPLRAPLSEIVRGLR